MLDRKIQEGHCICVLEWQRLVILSSFLHFVCLVHFRLFGIPLPHRMQHYPGHLSPHFWQLLVVLLHPRQIRDEVFRGYSKQCKARIVLKLGEISRYVFGLRKFHLNVNKLMYPNELYSTPANKGAIIPTTERLMLKQTKLMEEWCISNND